jgi:hypothetical protein
VFFESKFKKSSLIPAFSAEWIFYRIAVSMGVDFVAGKLLSNSVLMNYTYTSFTKAGLENRQRSFV